MVDRVLQNERAPLLSLRNANNLHYFKLEISKKVPFGTVWNFLTKGMELAKLTARRKNGC